MRIYILFLLPLFCTLKVSAQVIHVSTNNSSLVYHVSKKKVYQFHYGKKLENLDGIKQLKPFFDEAYPSFGNGSSNEVALVATHADGTMATDLVYISSEQKQEGDIQQTTIHLKDEKLPFFVDLHFNAYQKDDVVEQWATIKHDETGDVSLKQFASTAIGFKAESYYLSHFNGSWAREMRMSEEKLSNGVKNIETKRGVRTTEYENPSFILSLDQKASENNGEVYFGALAWMGNYRLSFQLDDQERCQLVGGISPFTSDYKLDPKELFQTPKMILTFSAKGKSRASINLHRWARSYNLRDGNQERPIVLNSWEGAYFSFDADVLKSMMDGAAEMGVEVFVLDDGWFGNKHPRNSDKAGLGDWQVNKKKLPKGIDDLIDHTEKLGMKFGIWVEPEMVNPKSELAEKHPDWIVQRMNGRQDMLERNQLLLDLSNPEVQDFSFGIMDELLTKHPRIAYIKWDANRHLQNFGSTYLDRENQSHLWIEYTRGLELVFKKLADKYPDVIVQACSSGGGRIDFSSMKYTHEFWASDNTDPYERLFIQWGTNHFFPPIAMGAHITKSPNHQTGRKTSLKFRTDVAFGGRLGIELSPNDLESSELEFVKEALELYKEIRPVIQFGDLYRLQSPYDADGYTSINYVAPEMDEAVLLVYSHDFHRRKERNFVRMKGLDPLASYQITEVNVSGNKGHFQANGQSISGAILMNRGIKVDLKKPLQSAVFRLKKITDN